MPRDVINQIEEQKDLLKEQGNNALANTLQKIGEQASNSKEDLRALNAIIQALTSGGTDLSKSIDKVVKYFEKYKSLAVESKQETNLLIGAYSNLGNSDQNIKKISDALYEVKKSQNGLGLNFRVSGIDSVSLLTKEIIKLKNILKDTTTEVSVDSKSLPKFATGGKVTGGPTSGDKIPALLNAKEWVFNQKQMNALGRMLSKDGKPLSHEEVFKLANSGVKNNSVVGKSVPKFANGGSASGANTVDEFQQRKRMNWSVAQTTNEKKQKTSEIDKSINNVQTQANSSSGSDKKTYQEMEKLLKELKKQYKSLDKEQIKVFDLDITKLGSFSGIQEQIKKIEELKEAQQKAIDEQIKKAEELKLAYEQLQDQVDSFKSDSAKNIADSAKNLAMEAKTSGGDREKQAKAKSMMSIAGTVDDIQKSGNQTAIKKSNDLMQRLSKPDISAEEVQLIESKFRKLFTELEKGQLQVGSLQNAFGKMQNDAKDLANQFNDFFGGTPVGLMAVGAGLALVAQKIAEVGDKVLDAAVEMSKMNIQMQLAGRTAQNAFGQGHAGAIQVFRNNMSLTREQVAKLTPQMADFVSNGNKGLQTLNVLAENIKNSLGTLDIQTFEKAMNLLKDIPEGQIEVLMGINNDSMDKMNTLTNLMDKGKLDMAIDLYEKGAFGEVEGEEQLSPGDKALLESNKAMEVLLEDIKFELYNSLPDFLKVLGPMGAKIITIAAALGTQILSSIKMVMALNMLRQQAFKSTDMPMNLKNTPIAVINQNEGQGSAAGGGGMPGGGKGGAGAGMAAAGIAAAGAAISAAIAGLGQMYDSYKAKKQQQAQEASAAKRDAQQRKEERQIKEVGFSKMQAVLPDMDKVKAAGIQMGREYAANARTVGYLTTGIASAVAGVAAFASATVATAATFGAAAPTYVAAAAATAQVAVAGAALTEMAAAAAQQLGQLKGQSEQLKRQLGENWKQSGMFRQGQDGEWVMDPVYLAIAQQQNMNFQKAQVQASIQRKQMLNDLKSLRKVDAILKEVKDGALTAYQDDSYKSAHASNDIMGVMGGSSQAFVENTNKAMKMATSSYTENMNAINKARKTLFDDETMSAEARSVALNKIRQQEAETIKKFVSSVMQSVGQYEKIPTIILNSIQNQMNKRNQDFQNKGMVGTGEDTRRTARQNVQNAKNNLDEAFKAHQQDLERIKEAKAKVDEQIKQATQNLGKAGSQSSVFSFFNQEQYAADVQQRARDKELKTAAGIEDNFGKTKRGSFKRGLNAYRHNVGRGDIDVTMLTSDEQARLQKAFKKRYGKNLTGSSVMGTGLKDGNGRQIQMTWDQFQSNKRSMKYLYEKEDRNKKVLNYRRNTGNNRLQIKNAWYDSWFQNTPDWAGPNAEKYWSKQKVDNIGKFAKDKLGVDLQSAITRDASGNVVKVDNKKMAEIDSKLQAEEVAIHQRYSKIKLQNGEREKGEARDRGFEHSKKLDETARKYGDSSMFEGQKGDTARAQATRQLDAQLSATRELLKQQRSAATTDAQRANIDAQLKALDDVEAQKNNLSGKFGNVEVQRLFKMMKGVTDNSSMGFEFKNMSNEDRQKLAVISQLRQSTQGYLQAGDSKIFTAKAEDRANQEILKQMQVYVDAVNEAIKYVDWNPTIQSLNKMNSVIQAGGSTLMSINGAAATLGNLWQNQADILVETQKNIDDIGSQIQSNNNAIKKMYEDAVKNFDVKDSVKQYMKKQQELLKAREEAVADPTNQEKRKRVEQLQAEVEGLSQNKDVQEFKNTTTGKSFDSLLAASSAGVEQMASLQVGQLQKMKNLARGFFDQAMSKISDMSNVVNQMAKFQLAQTTMEVGAQMFDRSKIQQGSKGSQEANKKRYEEESKALKQSYAASQKAMDAMIAQQQKKVDAAKTPEQKQAEQAKLDILKTEKDTNAAKFQQAMMRKELEMKRQVGQIAIKERDAKLAMINIEEQMVGIQLDLAQEIGAPYETIIGLEQKQVELAKKKAAQEEAALRNMEQNGATTKQIEEQKLRVAKANAEVTKSAMGAQRSAMEKLMGNMIGSFTQVAGIMGPGNKAQMFGQGYVQGTDGSAIGRGANMGYQERLAHANKNNGKDAYTGQDYNAGGGAKRKSQYDSVSQTVSESTTTTSANPTPGGDSKPKEESGQETGSETDAKKEERQKQKESIAQKSQEVQQVYGETTEDEKQALQKILAWVKKISDQIDFSIKEEEKPKNEQMDERHAKENKEREDDINAKQQEYHDAIAQAIGGEDLSDQERQQAIAKAKKAIESGQSVEGIDDETMSNLKTLQQNLSDAQENDRVEDLKAEYDNMVQEDYAKDPQQQIAQMSASVVGIGELLKNIDANISTIAQSFNVTSSQVSATSPEATPNTNGGSSSNPTPSGSSEGEVYGTIKVQVQVVSNDQMFETKVKNIVIKEAKKIVLQGMTG